MRCYLFSSSCSLAAILAVAILGHGALVASDELSSTLNVGVYYESLCGDSIRFFKNQLVPSYDSVKDYVKFTFVPYGKASQARDPRTNEWKFSCQHGPAECEGNMAQACGIHAIQNGEPAEKVQQLTVSLLGCVMSARYPPTSVPQCAKKAGLSEQTQQSIAQCIAGPLAKELLAANGDQTNALQPKLSFVPTVTVNGVVDYPGSHHFQVGSDEIQRLALSNFRKLVCDNLPNDGRPAQCSSA
ncbi:unnamed protein product [Xylocopa violacea]|uniref:Gamma-interferon-inducible lysosomal thiol reductase n=1 Tax=Xylocopa violacea TaxID=135666 RepID=A0ABP1NGQ1_XYLVO